MPQIRRRLNYVNVVATLALVIAVAGIPTAVAVTVSATKKGNIRAGRVTATKLADGSVTAGKLGQIDVVEATGTLNAQANCPAGTRLLSGGSRPSASSYPAGNGWFGSAPTTSTVTVYALCLRG